MNNRPHEACEYRYILPVTCSASAIFSSSDKEIRIMFEKTLTDLVRGIRAHKGEESQFIVQCLTEIKSELRQENALVKANAVSKLTYLQMLGYDVSWAAFNVIEVMSNPRFTCKRIGYLAATQCFSEDTDVIMLCTNLIRKDLSSGNIYDASLALNGLACFATPDLSRDLANDVLALAVSSKPYLRKKAILVLYRVFLKFPDALRPAYPRLKEKIEDPDSGVQCAAISVICELARKNPKNYLSLAPTLFKIMTTSSNNWMLIKVIKLFGSLAPLEPRLAKKLQEPLTSLIHSTSAMSLLYECISTMVCGLPHNTVAMQLCASKLRLFIEDTDQNLRYLGLLAMSKILHNQPKAVLQLKDLVMECLQSHDESIRLRALDLIIGMVNKKNLVDIIRQLIGHVDESESTYYRDEVISKMIQMCRQSNYQFITNFEWYITILVELTKFESTKHGKLIASQMLDVTIRVKDVRPFSVKQMATILDNMNVLVMSNTKDGVCEVLYAAAWIVGEFSEHLPSPQATLEIMLSSKVTSLPGHIQAVFVQNVVKLYASILVQAEAQGTPEAVEEVGAMLVDRLPVFIQSGDLEVQERACCILQLMKYIVKLQGKGASVGDELAALFVGDLNPVAPKAQKKVPVPEGLDLDKWINDPPPESDEDNQVDGGDFSFLSAKGEFDDDLSGKKKKKKGKGKKGVEEEDEEDQEELERRRKQREEERASNPHYLPMATKKAKESAEAKEEGQSVPVSKINLGSLSLVIDEPKEKGKKGRKGKRGKKGRKAKHSDEEEGRPVVMVTGEEEMPDGATGGGSSGEDAVGESKLDELSKAHQMLNVDLSAPLRDDEALPVPKHREVSSSVFKLTDPEEKGKEKKKKKKKGKVLEIEEDEKEGEEEEVVVKKSSHKKKEKSEKGRKRKQKGRAQEASTSLVEMGEEEEATREEGGPSKADMNDLEFWLTDTSKPAPPHPTVATPATQIRTPAKEEEKEEEEEETRKGRKSGKTRKGEKGQRSGKKAKQPKRKEEELPVASETASAGAGLDDLLGGEQSSTKSDQWRPLTEDGNIKMTYALRPHLINSGLVYVPVVFCNTSGVTLVSLNFNVLDSLNTKLDRDGTRGDEGVPVPFSLPVGVSNQYQFMFRVKSVNVAQRLRGTLTYMTKGEGGTSSEKLDFKLSFPCSGFITPVPCAQDDFTALLKGGQLCDTQSIKMKLAKSGEFSVALETVVRTMHLAVVEQVEDGASLHGVSLNNDHVCFLLKAVDTSAVMVNAKGSDATLISNLLDEVRTIL